MRDEISLWAEQAEIDLNAAETNYNQKLYYVCAFLSQQAVEKMLKAVYMQKFKEKPESSHNLRKLAEELELPEELLMKAKRLTKDFFISRYPDAAGDVPAKVYDKENSKDILEDAKEILKWLEEKL